jgi:hypothetical protein
MDALAQAMAAWSKMPSNMMTNGFKAVQERAIQLAEENAETTFTLSSELARAKDLQEVMTLQSRCAQNPMRS